MRRPEADRSADLALSRDLRSPTEENISLRASRLSRTLVNSDRGSRTRLARRHIEEMHVLHRLMFLAIDSIASLAPAVDQDPAASFCDESFRCRPACSPDAGFRALDA